jgi:hypothetical protein
MSWRILILLTGAAIAFGSGWLANGWRLNQQIERMHAEQAQAELSAALDAGIKTAELTKQVEDARNEATKREQDLRRSAAGARAAADGLRDELAAIRQSLPDLAGDACRQRADTLADILAQCSGNYRELAEKADRIASDRQTLIQAWPK